MRRIQGTSGASGAESRSGSGSGFGHGNGNGMGTGPGLGPGGTGYFRTLANKGSFVTVFSEEASTGAGSGSRNNNIGSPVIQGGGPSTPPQFHLTTPEARSPSSSMWSLPSSDRQPKTHAYPEQGLVPSSSRQTPRKDQANHNYNQTSPHLSPMPTPPPSSLHRNPHSETYSLDPQFHPRRIERSSSNRSTPSEGRSRINSAFESRRPNIPAIHIPDSHKYANTQISTNSNGNTNTGTNTTTNSRERPKSTEFFLAGNQQEQQKVFDSPVSMRSVVPPPRANASSNGLDSLSLGRPL